MQNLEKFEFAYAGGDLFLFKAYADGKEVYNQYIHANEFQSAVDKFTRDYYLRGLSKWKN